MKFIILAFLIFTLPAPIIYLLSGRPAEAQFTNQFATQAGNVPAAQLDANFASAGAMGVFECTASGTNTISLVVAPNQPLLIGYTGFNNFPLFSFVPVATPTGPVVVNINSLANHNLYYPDGLTQATAGAFNPNELVIIGYNPGASSGSGGFQIINVLNITPGQYPGTTTNDAAAAGNIGQIIASTVPSASGVALTSGTTSNVTSITLPAGDWDVWGGVQYLPGSSTVTTLLQASISPVSATQFGQPPQYALVNGFTITGTNVPTLELPGVPMEVSGSQTVYLVAEAAFTTSTNKAYGSIYARRVR